MSHPTQSSILAALGRKIMTIKELAAACGHEYVKVQRLTARMYREGKLQRNNPPQHIPVKYWDPSLD